MKASGKNYNIFNSKGLYEEGLNEVHSHYIRRCMRGIDCYIDLLLYCIVFILIAQRKRDSNAVFVYWSNIKLPIRYHQN